MIQNLKANVFMPALLGLGIIALCGISCHKDDIPDLFVDNSLQVYFDRFVAEGALRNVIVDYKTAGVSGYIKAISSPHVIGQCVHDKNIPNTVIIDRSYWENGSDLEKEFLVFHELGHCALNREHLDEGDKNGNCISIMTSGSAQCRINYTVNTREQLLDELFKQ